MKFDILYEELRQQLELDFSAKKHMNTKPEWAIACGDLCDDVLKKYYPIKNMPKSNKRSIAFRKFWTTIVNILSGKGFTSYKMQSLGIPEYILNRYN